MRVNAKGLWAVGALTVTASLVLTGCTAASDPANNGSGNGESLTVWVDADRAAVLKDAAADFTAETGVEVKLVQKEFGDIRDQFIAQAPTGKGPDIVIGAHDWLGTFVTNGVVAPVELGDKADAFQDVAITAMSYEGQVYGVPYSIENIALVRNTALAPSTPATFDEMVTMGQAAGTEYPFLVGLDPEAADPYHLYPFQTSFGAPVFGTAGGEAAQPFVGVQGFFVSSKSENALAANEFIVNYMGSEDVQTALFEVGGRAPALTASFEAASEDPIVAVGENAVPMPSIPAMGAVWEFWGVTEAAIINGGDPASLWQKMSGDIQTAIAG